MASKGTKGCCGDLCAFCRVSNLNYESVRIDSKTVLFIRANPDMKETAEGAGFKCQFYFETVPFSGSGKSRNMVRDQYQAMGLVIFPRTYPHRPNV